jgi:hypothetical protein
MTRRSFVVTDSVDYSPIPEGGLMADPVSGIHTPCVLRGEALRSWLSASWRWSAPVRDSSCWKGMTNAANGRPRARSRTAGACATRRSTRATASTRVRGQPQRLRSVRPALDGRRWDPEAVEAGLPARGLGADGKRGMAHRARPSAGARRRDVRAPPVLPLVRLE